MSHHQSSFSIYRAASKASEAAVVAAMLKATSEACYFMPEKLLKLHLLGRSAVRAVRSEEQVNRVLSHVPTSAREPLVLPTRGLHVSNTDSTQLAPLSLCSLKTLLKPIFVKQSRFTMLLPEKWRQIQFPHVFYLAMSSVV